MLIGTSSSFSKVRFRTTLLKSLRRRTDRDSSSVLEMVLSFTRIQWDFVLSDDVTLSTFSSLMTILLLFLEFFLRLWRLPASSNALTAWTFRLTCPWRDTPAPILNRILVTTLSCEKTSDLPFFVVVLLCPLLREFKNKFKKCPPFNTGMNVTSNWFLHTPRAMFTCLYLRPGISNSKQLI